jgi:hypothetical protein
VGGGGCRPAAPPPVGCAPESINQKQHVGGIFFDLDKAFDCENHKMLLAKLHLYDIHGVFCEPSGTGNTITVINMPIKLAI